MFYIILTPRWGTDIKDAINEAINLINEPLMQSFCGVTLLFNDVNLDITVDSDADLLYTRYSEEMKGK